MVLLAQLCTSAPIPVSSQEDSMPRTGTAVLIVHLSVALCAWLWLQ